MAEKKTALVAGGTGSIGEGIVRVLLAADYEVFVPIRKVDKSDRLTAYVGDIRTGKLHLIPGDLSDSESVKQSKAQILSMTPKLDLVAVSVGSSYYGYSLHKIPQSEWNKFIDENLITHFNLQHEYLDLLHSQGSGVFITLTGPEANYVHQETGLMSVVCAAQKMMARVAAMEAFGTKVKVYSVTSNTPIASRARGGQVSEEWPNTTDIGEYLLALAEQNLPNSGDSTHEIQSRAMIRKLLKKN